VDGIACGREAIEAISTTDYDALILDLGVPEMDGMEVLARIRLSKERPLKWHEYRD
jgi:DNA-binding response OmpR family regulator